MTHDGTGIVAVRSEQGYDVGFTAHCADCVWYGELRDTYGAAAMDLWQHIRETKGDT